MRPAAPYSRDWKLTSEQSDNFGINSSDCNERSYKITCRMCCGSATISSSQYKSDNMKMITQNNTINSTDCDPIVSVETDRLTNGL
jgi:hypothetical protein